MSFYKELSSSHDTDIDTVCGIQFCLLSAENILANSVCEINKTDTYDGNEPWPNGLFDPRMGVIEHGKVCVTCEQKNTFCPGHFGHITLNKPVFYVKFFPNVKNILKCVCFRCSKLLIDPESDEVQNLLQKKYSRQKRWEAVLKLCSKAKKCGQYNPHGCGAKLPTINKEGMLKLSLEWKDFGEIGDAKKQVWQAEDVLRVFKRISDRDAEILGFHKKYNRPEDLICTVLPVPPPSVRPSVRNDTGQRSEDDLTHKLSMIVKVNNNLKQKIEKGAKEQIDMYAMLLQYEVATLIDNTMPGIPPSQQRTGRPIRSLVERLKGKEGRIRGNLMGKRVDFSARSVITPDPNISIDELGVPIKIAMNLTFPEIVNKYNIEELQQYVLNGPDNYPGAKYVRKAGEERTIRLRNMNRNEIKLENGDVVERHLKDGDYVLFNRQPSLHRSSMMAHRARVMPFNTFRLNVMVTPSFNADFDGDEMNMHVAQSLQSHEELLQLAAVPTQIISPRECKPIVSIVQDNVVGIYRLTRDNVRISQKQFFNLMALNPACTGKYMRPAYHNGKKDYWSGQQILTTIMPKKINMYMPNNQYDEAKDNDHNIVVIKNGEVQKGVFDKDTYQARTHGIIHSIYNEYGAEETKLFFDNTQKLICNWLVIAGFSVGISDLIVDNDTKKSFQKSITDMKARVHTIIDSIHANTFENKSTKKNSEDFEKKVNDILNEAIKKVGDSGAKHIDENKNRMISMIKSKSKGNTINVSQMIGCLGQQNVDGRRIPYGFDDRTLPHYTKYDDGPEARGFVENSFIKGLTPQEFFFSAMGGREGLIDTAVQTSETGYIQRKLVKAMEDCKVFYDLSVRNASGTIIQYLYGEDGMDSSKIESQSVPIINVDDVRKEYSFTKADLKSILPKDIYDQVDKDQDKWTKMMGKHLSQLEEDRNYLITKLFNYKVESSVMYPVSFTRIINIAKSIYSGPISDLTPEFVLKTIDNLCTELYVNEHHKGNHLFKILIRCYLSPKQVIVKHKLCKAAFDYIVEQIKMRFLESLAHPSEMVGVIAAQSIGEPATQLTLNTFHLAGVSAASKTVRGVPRLKELLSVSKNMKTPTMRIHFHDKYKFDQAKCLELMNNIRIVRFKDIVTSSKIFFDPNNCYHGDVAFIDQYKLFAAENDSCKTSPWLLRLAFDKESMLKYTLDMNQIHQKLLEYYGDSTISCKFNDDNAENLIFRIKLNLSDSQITDSDDTLTELKALEYNILEKIIIKGTENIEKVSIIEEEGSRYNPVTKKFEKISEYVVYTEGTNIRDIFALDFINAGITITNNINEIYEVLGIEAARQALYNEIQEVMDSITINYRHTSLLIDVMTNKGYIISIDRHGINRGDIGPLAKCSFEETTDKLIKAGIFAEYDKINGVSANIILGQIVPAGTGDVNVIIDQNKLPDGVTNNKLYDIPEEESVNQCEEDNFTFDFVMPQKKIIQDREKRIENELVEEETNPSPVPKKRGPARKTKAK